MRLSQVSEHGRFEVLRDGEFHSLGLLSHGGEKMLVVLYDPNFLEKLLANPQIAAVITNREIAGRLPMELAVGVAEDPMASFQHVHTWLDRHTEFYWKNFESEISPEAIIHPGAIVAPRNVRIGRGTEIGPRAIVLERSLLGEDVIIGPGAVIGGEGFEPKNVAGKKVIVTHAGGVRLGDRVVVMANSHLARAVYGGFTEIGDDTKIDAMNHIAHNVTVGRRCEIAAGAIIAGSSSVGDDVWVGPGAIISSEIRVGDRAFVALGSVVIKNVEPGARVFGVPARVAPPAGR